MKKFILLIVFAYVLSCVQPTRLARPVSTTGDDASCLAILGMVQLTGSVSVGIRKDFYYRVYDKGYIQFSESTNFTENEDEISSGLIIFNPQTDQGKYTPNFGAIFTDNSGVRIVRDKVIDENSIYIVFGGFKPGIRYALTRIGYTRTETYKVGNNTYTRSVPVNIYGNLSQNLKSFPIYCNPGKANFLGIASLKVSGEKFTIDGDALTEIAEKADDEILRHFFGKYQQTKKGAAWYIKDEMNKTESPRHEENGYWYKILNPDENIETIKSQ